MSSDLLARLALTMMGIIQICNGFSQRLDPSCRTVFPAGKSDIDRLRSFKAAFDIVANLWGALTEVCPF